MAALALACGSNSRDFNRQNQAGGSGAAGAGGEETGGTGPSLSACGDEGTRQCSGAITQVCTDGFWRNGAVCTNGCTGEGICSCVGGARQCEGNTPQMCLNSAWVDETSCDGVIEVCTGAGVCAPFKLLDAGIVTVASPAAAESSPLKRHTLTVGQRICDPDYCMSGEIR